MLSTVDSGNSVNGNEGGRFNIVSSLRVDDKGTDTRGSLFEITDSGGDNPVCLIVTADIDLTDDTPVFPNVSVEDGHC